MTCVVFAGPSVADLDAVAFAGVDLQPPAACGDILTAVRRGATRIGLIDGVFGSVAAVWHKEILWALDRGVRVIGAASMGALRAAECSRFGMEGVGRIFEDYAAGRRWADADVAVLHAPAELGWRPLSEPLVDVDATLDRLLALDLIDGGDAARARTAAHAIHYRDRTWSEIAARAFRDPARRDEIEALATQHGVRLKEQDARALLCALADAQAAPHPGSRLAAGPLSRTAYLGLLARRVGVRNGAHPV